MWLGHVLRMHPRFALTWVWRQKENEPPTWNVEEDGWKGDEGEGFEYVGKDGSCSSRQSSTQPNFLLGEMDFDAQFYYIISEIIENDQQRSNPVLKTWSKYYGTDIIILAMSRSHGNWLNPTNKANGNSLHVHGFNHVQKPSYDKYRPLLSRDA